RYIDEAWSEFKQLFMHMESEPAKQVLTQIEQSIVALRNALQVNDSLDRSQLTELAATLENLSEHLQFDSRSWLSRERDNIRRPAEQELAALVAASKQFH